MTAPPLSDTVETTASPAVSSLRSRFEKLAADSSLPSSPSPLKTSGNHANLVASPIPLSPRVRPVHAPDHDRDVSDSSAQFLHPASSSPDLRTVGKRPPPPPPLRPPSRAPSPAPPRLSPFLRPVPDPSPALGDSDIPADPLPVANKAALLSRRPPPPPPTQDHSTQRSLGVSSLVKQFGNGALPPAASPPKQPAPPVRPPSQILIDGLPTPEPPEPPYARRPRQSFPPDHIPHSASSSSLLSPDPSSDGFDPFDDIHSDTEVIHPNPDHRPPPLPQRNGSVIFANHTPELSSDSASTSSGASSSRTSSDNDPVTKPILQSSPQPPASPRPHLVPPPRPPPRHRVTLQTSGIASTSSTSLSATSMTPPPLPARKGAVPPIDDHMLPKSLPSRHHSVHEVEISQVVGASVQNALPERKQFGNHLPPPTRTIALGDKLPPPRRTAGSGSSSESEEDDEVKTKIDLLPDASRASRRPPLVDCHNYSEFNIHIPAYTGSVAVSGHAVAVVSHHHLRIYDLSISDSPIWNLDSKNGDFDTKVKDFKITSVGFRPTENQEDRGAFLWIGSKDGHLLELDVRTGKVNAMRPAIHAHTVTHMFRHGRSMITLDDTGKVLVFTPPGGVDLDLATQTPRVVRIAEKQEFAKMLGGQLWTSTRDPAGGGSVPGTSRGPYIRVYDVFTQGSVGRSLLPSEHLGAVTAGTVLPSDPAHAYLAHEGGHISIWSVGNGESAPQCLEVIKVSTSDILSLEGVNDRLWAGGRKGTISAYDVTSKPWTVTNSWAAHQKLPVLRIAVDTWSMEKLDRLVVFSVGRDEKLRFWDGLLGIDWIDQELLKRETEFSTFRDKTVLIVSWNVDSAKPDTLTGTTENVNFLQDVLQTMDRPDIIAFGMQELIDLESRKMAAKTVLLGGKNKSADGSISQKVTTSYKKWYDRLVLAVRLAMPADEPYTVIHTENLVGLFTCIFVKNTEKISLKHVALTTVKRGMGGRYGNKGGIVARFVIDDTSICFINCHLAAGQHHVRQRNSDAAAIVEDKSLLPESGPLEEGVAYVNGGDGTMVLDHEIVFMNGDMNYRIDQRREAVIAAVKAGDFEHLVIHDQLRKEMKFNRAFRLRHFCEGPLDFAPTYKYDRRSEEYDTSEKARTPAWCDRVLWRSLVPERVEQLHYRRWEANVSDHRPISAGFKMTVKSVKHEVRARVKAEVQERWKEVERDFLAAALQYYIAQKMI